MGRDIVIINVLRVSIEALCDVYFFFLGSIKKINDTRNKRLPGRFFEELKSSLPSHLVAPN
jgi:hypothetical protein